MKDYRPGPGWKHLAGPVWEHASGARVHTLGLVKLPTGTFLDLNHMRENEIGLRLVRINSGNRRRGLMAWARRLSLEVRK